MSSTPPNDDYHFDLGGLLDAVHAEEEKELRALSGTTPSPTNNNNMIVGLHGVEGQSPTVTPTPHAMAPSPVAPGPLHGIGIVPLQGGGLNGGGGSSNNGSGVQQQPNTSNTTSSTIGLSLNNATTPSKDPMADLHSWVRDRTPNGLGSGVLRDTNTPTPTNSSSYVTRGASASSPISNFAMGTPPHAGRPTSNAGGAGGAAPSNQFTALSAGNPNNASTGSLLGLMADNSGTTASLNGTASSLFGSPQSATKGGPSSIGQQQPQPQQPGFALFGSNPNPSSSRPHGGNQQMGDVRQIRQVHSGSGYEMQSNGSGAGGTPMGFDSQNRGFGRPGNSPMVPPSPIRPGSGTMTPQLFPPVDGGNTTTPRHGQRSSAFQPVHLTGASGMQMPMQMTTPNSSGWTPSPILFSSSNGGGPGSSLQQQIQQQQPSPVRGTTPLDEAQQQTHFASLQGRMVEAAKDQAGCRILQQFLDNPFESNEVQTVLNEIMPSVAELMEHPYGNFLIQKLLDVAPDTIRLTITAQIAPHLPQVATTQHGTFAVQKLIESFRSVEERVVACQGLATNVTLLMTDGFGAHVVQKLLACISAPNRQFLYDGIAANTVPICNHKHGCCVAQRCIENGNMDQRVQVLAAVVKEYSHLIVNPYGNYVMQFLMEHVPEATSHFVQRLVEHSDSDIVYIATSKFGSNVVETALKRCNPEVASLLINKVCHLQTLQALVMDRYGNYVIQTALTVASPNSASVLVAALMPMLPQIRQQPYGRKFEGKVEAAVKRTGGGPTGGCGGGMLDLNQFQQQQQQNTLPLSLHPEMLGERGGGGVGGMMGISPQRGGGNGGHAVHGMMGMPASPSGQPPLHITQALQSSPSRGSQPRPMPTQFHPFNARGGNSSGSSPTQQFNGGSSGGSGGVPSPLVPCPGSTTPFIPRALPGQPSAPAPAGMNWTSGANSQPTQFTSPHQQMPPPQQQQQQGPAPVGPVPVAGFTVYPSMVSPSPVKSTGSLSPGQYGGKTGGGGGLGSMDGYHQSSGY